MKKYICLIVLLIISSLIFSGCVTTSGIGEKYALPGRHWWNQQPKTVELQNDLEKIMTEYRITAPVSVVIIGSNEALAEKYVKEALAGFGFELYLNGYQGQVDYQLTVERMDIGQKNSGYGGYGYGYGYSGNTEAVVEIRLSVLEGNRERYFIGVGSYSYQAFYEGYYYQVERIQDPYQLATKIAAAKAVAKFIDEENIPHHIPEKK